MTSRIIIAPDPIDMRQELAATLRPSPVFSFPEEEGSDFLIEDAHALIAHAYIASSEPKYCLIAARKFGDAAQNALLKLLEEPPHNVVFIVIASSKTALLPTIRSRLPIHARPRAPRVRTGSGLNLARLDLKSIFTFLKEHERISKEEAKTLLEELFFEFSALPPLPPSRQTREIELFEKGFAMLDLNSRPATVLATVLAVLAERRG